MGDSPIKAQFKSSAFPKSQKGKNIFYFIALFCMWSILFTGDKNEAKKK
jgi:hypothetical protein